MRRVETAAAGSALLGGGIWLVQGAVLIARNGAEYRIEPVMFVCGFAALVAAGGLAGWDRARGKARLAQALIAVLAALCVPLVLFVGQVLAFPLPGSHWLESDAIFLVMALVATCWGIRVLRRRSTRRLD